MSPASDAFWLRVQRRASTVTPEVAALILRAYQVIRDSLSEAELVRIIESGQIEPLFAAALSDAALDRAFLPVRTRLFRQVEQNVRYFARDLPKGGVVDGTVAVAFDVLNPKMIDAIRALDTKVIQGLKNDVRDTARAYIENGIRDGVNPREIARSLRDVIGLAPNQEAAVQNFERALRGTNPNAGPLDYALRDRRFDATIKRGELTEGQIDLMTDAYRRKMIAFNAETNARTAMLDSMKQGQALSWQDAVDKGIVDGGALMKTWSGVLDDRERDEHLAMEGETVPFDEPYSNGNMIPGDDTYNCRCLSVVFIEPNAGRVAA